MEQGDTQKKYPLSHLIIVTLIYIAITMIMTWPMIMRLSSEYAGGNSDLWVHQWTFWWLKEALTTEQNPFYTTMLYYPEGTSLLSHNIAWLNIAFWLPLQTFIGEIAAYNVMFLTIYLLNSLSMFLFARELMRRELAAFIAGLIFGFWPYTFSHYDHPNMILLFAIPLTLLFITRTIKTQTWRQALLAALFLALIGISRWQLLVMSSPLIVGYTLYQLYLNPQAQHRRTGKLLAAILVVGFVLMLPLALPLIISQLSQDAANIFIAEPDFGRTDLLAYFVPPTLFENIWGKFALNANPYYERPYHHIAASAHYVPFIGYAVLLLTLLGIFKRRSQTWFWLLMAGLYIIMALGPQLVINGRVWLELMPYRLIQNSLLGEFIRRPHRLNVILSLPVGMLAGYGTAVLLDVLQSKANKRWAIAFTTIIAILILAEYRQTVPFITTPYHLPPWYQQVADDSEMYGILGLPIEDRFADKWYMSYQISTGKPIAGGHVSRLSPETFRTLKAVPFLENFLAHEDEIDSSQTDVSNQLQILAEAGIRYIVINKQFVEEGFYQTWQDWLTIDSVFEDDETAVYHTQPQYGTDYNFIHELTDDIGLLRLNYAPNIVVVDEMIKVDARYGSRAVPPDDYQVCFTLTTAFTEPIDRVESFTMHCEDIAPGRKSSQWQANEVIRRTHLLPVDTAVAPGSYTLIMQLIESKSQNYIGQPQILGLVTVDDALPTTFSDAVWNDEIKLLGYDTHWIDFDLNLDFFWQGTQTMTEPYALFVHIIDSNTGQLMRQKDIVPRNWTYPTIAWEPGEMVHTQLEFPLKALSAGNYDLVVGWYDQASGERLTAVNTDTPQSSNAVQLFNIIVP